MRWFALAVVGMALSSGAQAQTPPPREFRAAWVATVSNLDWPSARTLTTTQQQNEIIAILNAAQNLRLNAVIVQVRPQCDALYQSSAEPWSEYLTNLMGNPPNPFYDPLNFWIAEGKKRGIQIHAWINPYRAKSGTATVSTPLHVTNSRPYMVRTYGTNKWLDPGHPDAPVYTKAAIMDIVNRYDIDGITLDDYFYPYPISGEEFPDAETYNAYVLGGGTLSKANWRRKNVDDFISSAYAQIKATKPWVKFGIAPFGIWRPNNPPGVTGLDSYASIYADSKKWLNNGWCDIFSPQLYWKLSSSGQPFGALCDWWVSQNTQGRIVAPSLATYNIVSASWPTQEILDQISRTRQNVGAKGNIHFRMEFLQINSGGVASQLSSGLYAQQALIPEFNWLDSTPPPKPAIKFSQSGSTINFEIHKGAGEDPQNYVVYTRYGSAWSHQIIPADVDPKPFSRGVIQGSSSLHTVFVSAVDRNGKESARAMAAFQGGSDSR